MSIQCLDFSYFRGAGNPNKDRNSTFGTAPLSEGTLRLSALSPLRRPCALSALSPLSEGTLHPVSSLPSE